VAMSGLHPPAQGNGFNNEPNRTVAPTTTTTTTAVAAPAIPTTTATTTTTTSSGAVALEIGGYKVHPSALAPNTTIAGSPSNTFTTMTAGQLAATLAANDSLRNSNNEHSNNNTNDPSGRRNTSDSGVISDLVVRMLPIALGSLVGYIVYVYNVRLCCTSVSCCLCCLRRRFNSFFSGRTDCSSIAHQPPSTVF
jgi:hypothetical protein